MKFLLQFDWVIKYLLNIIYIIISHYYANTHFMYSTILSEAFHFIEYKTITTNNKKIYYSIKFKQ